VGVAPGKKDIIGDGKGHLNGALFLFKAFQFSELKIDSDKQPIQTNKLKGVRVNHLRANL
jgi:hypothetical protein